MATHSGRVPQRRHIQWAAYYPDETTMVVLLGSALGVSLFRLFQLELKTREQQHQLKSKEDALKTREKSYSDIEKELRANSDKLLQKYNKLRDEKKRMEASIIDRGNTANKNPVVDTVSVKMTQSLTGLQPDRKLGMSLISTTNLQPFCIYNRPCGH